MSLRILPDFLKRGDPAWGGQHAEKRRAVRHGAEMLASGDHGDVAEAVRAWRARVEAPND